MLKDVQEIMSGDVAHAAEWLWYEEFSKAEALAIQARIQSDPKYREDLDGLLSVFASMEGLAGNRAIEAIARNYRHLLRGHRTKRRFAVGMAAGILAALGAVLAVFLSGPGDHSLPMYYTRIGEQQTIELNDGSVVTLNTGSQLMVDYGKRERRILLEEGEAFFVVAEDSERIFTVDLGTHAVTALGTTFNVRKDPGRYQVAVLEGAVALHETTGVVSRSPPPVSADGQAVVLAKPGPRRIEAGWVAEFQVSRDAITAFRPDSMERYEGWRSGLLTFYSEPLYSVIQELNRYTRNRILIEDASIMELDVSMVIGVTGIDAALNNLDQVLPVEVTRNYDRIVITALVEN